jgi:hypothetical protein
MYNTVAIYKTQLGCATSSSTYIRTLDVMHQREGRRKPGDVTILPVFVPFLQILHKTMIMTQVTH